MSVVVPAFNAEEFIEQSLRSVFSQTLSNFEVIVVDDCSSDQTGAIVRRLSTEDPRLTYLRLPVNSGTPAVPRNIGIMRATGDWVAFLDSDDLWHPEKLARQVEVATNMRAWSCSTGMRDFHSVVPTVFIPESCRIEKVSLRMQLAKYRTPTSSILIRKAVADTCLFPEDLYLRGREDLAWSLRAHERFGDSVKLGAPFVFYRQHSGQISGRKVKMYRMVGVVLRDFRFSNGKRLGVTRWFFMLQYAVLAVYMRVAARRL